jgi:hypothetical protein
MIYFGQVLISQSRALNLFLSLAVAFSHIHSAIRDTLMSCGSSIKLHVPALMCLCGDALKYAFGDSLSGKWDSSSTLSHGMIGLEFMRTSKLC